MKYCKSTTICLTSKHKHGNCKNKVLKMQSCLLLSSVYCFHHAAKTRHLHKCIGSNRLCNFNHVLSFLRKKCSRVPFVIHQDFVTLEINKEIMVKNQNMQSRPDVRVSHLGATQKKRLAFA